ncbi:VOC family protein [Streptomyces sp. NPDC051907]|uniref:VOC family protein n=1 Tax=Streptomyces sp. NPDC051907 TaxID=3155284 RepID=UPI0034124A96
MSDASGAAVLEASATGADPARLSLHHIAVQTGDLDASIAWYREFFGAEVKWTLNAFSDLSMERLPGLSGLAEVVAGGLRFHLFTRGPEHGVLPPADSNQYQHICIEAGTPEELRSWHAKWTSVYESGAHSFARREAATDIVVDGDGVESFYAFDVNGLEFEFTYLPGERP